MFAVKKLVRCIDVIVGLCFNFSLCKHTSQYSICYLSSVSQSQQVFDLTHATISSAIKNPFLSPGMFMYLCHVPHSLSQSLLYVTCDHKGPSIVVSLLHKEWARIDEQEWHNVPMVTVCVTMGVTVPILLNGGREFVCVCLGAFFFFNWTSRNQGNIFVLVQCWAAH